MFPDGRMDAKNAAAYLDKSPKTLANMRSLGTGPRFMKLGKIYYYQADLDDWIAAHERVSSTAQARLPRPGRDAVEDAVDRADAELGRQVREQRRRYAQRGREYQESQKKQEWAPCIEVMRQVLEARPDLSNAEVARQVIELTRKSPTPCKKSEETLRKEVAKLRPSRASKSGSPP